MQASWLRLTYWRHLNRLAQGASNTFPKTTESVALLPSGRRRKILEHLYRHLIQLLLVLFSDRRLEIRSIEVPGARRPISLFNLVQEESRWAQEEGS